MTTEEVTRVDTTGNQVRTTKAVTETVETDTSEVEITSGGVEVEPVNGQNNGQ